MTHRKTLPLDDYDNKPTGIVAGVGSCVFFSNKLAHKNTKRPPLRDLLPHSTQLRAIQRQDAAEARHQDLNALWQAWWSVRDAEEVWRLSRLLAGCPFGPKRRNQTQAAAPSAGQSFGKVSKSGPEGGLLATENDWGAFCLEADAAAWGQGL